MKYSFFTIDDNCMTGVTTTLITNDDVNVLAKQVYDFSQTLDVFVLEFGIQNNKYGRAIAAGMFKSVVGIILLFGANFVAKKMDEETLL